MTATSLRRATVCAALTTVLNGVAHKSDACPGAAATPRHDFTVAEAILTRVLGKQEELEERLAGGWGPIRLAYVHAPDGTVAASLAKLAPPAGIELRTYALPARPDVLRDTAARITGEQPDWIVVSVDRPWFGAVVLALSAANAPVEQILRHEHYPQRAAHREHCGR